MLNIIYIFINIIVDKYLNNYNYFYILNLVNKKLINFIIIILLYKCYAFSYF